MAGRVIFLRNTGKLCFATLREGGGTELQAMLSLDRVGPDSLAALEGRRRPRRPRLRARRGDHLAARRAVRAGRRWQMTAKALRPLPVAHKPMSEEARVRQRYVDLIVRPQARGDGRRPLTVVRTSRDVARAGFVEVETPMLQVLHGGAAARPFVTHSNALDMDLYLRIAPELFPQAGPWSAASRGCSRSIATSATRASTPRTARVRDAGGVTRRTATYDRWPT